MTDEGMKPGFYRFNSTTGDVGGRDADNLMVGFYEEFEGTDGEFEIEFSDLGPHIHLPVDSWATLATLPGFTDLLKKLDSKTVSLKEMVKNLKKLGYQEIVDI